VLEPDRSRRSPRPDGALARECRRRRSALLAARWLLCIAGAALAADDRRIAISGEPLEDLLGRSDRPGVAAAIVRPEPFPEARAWVVEEDVSGSVAVGEQLEFSSCAPVLRIGSTPDHIRSLVTRAAVVDGEVERHRSLVLPPGKPLSEFAAPRRSDRFLLLFEPRPEGRWAFAVQTVGDVYLLRGERVFRTAWVERGDTRTPTSKIIWAPVDETSRTALLERVRKRHGTIGR
ncbi:MAG: hypothetical protein ACREQ9_05525, partial [Candidatus Binatia bacterium]